MPETQIEEATTGIRKLFADFSYPSILAIIQDKNAMENRFQNASVGYEKLQLFRIYVDVHGDKSALDSILQKFINESFHIENEYIMQLNPHKFDNIPPHIIQECNRLMPVSR